MKRLFPFVFFVMSLGAQAQTLSRPKLVVGIVVDQMRWDYLYRFYDRYSSDGFKRLLKEGFSCENTFIPYTPTYTAAGHACIYTGSVPALNGIMGNSWYNRIQKKVFYCTEDNSVQPVGTTSSAGKMSPANMWSNTITDELRLATNFRNKTITIALKDRGAVLPGGYTANGAYWFDNSTGGFISSTFYMQDLPQWVKKFNDRKLPDAYLKQNWNTLYPIETYKQSTADSNSYEGKIGGEDFTFPHTTASIQSNKYESFKTTPGGNTYTFEMAKAAIEAEGLGKGAQTDFLALSFSSTDYIGHTFGPNSIEVEDAYLRLDQDMGSFLKYLDATVGKGQYLIFLTADHGAAHNPSFLKDHRLAAGTSNEAEVHRQLNDSVAKTFKVKNVIAQFINYQIFFDDSIIAENHMDKVSIKQYIARFMIKQPAVSNVIDLGNLAATSLPDKLKMMVTNGYNQKLSGDMQIVFKPQWFESLTAGTTHGLWNPYDSHIPLVWFGWNVKPGKLNREVYMTDIAATLAALLRVQMPNGAVGKVIEEVGK